MQRKNPNGVGGEKVARRPRRGAAAVVGVLAMLCAAGCEQHSGASDYRIFRGVITSLNNETGELVLEATVADRPGVEDPAAGARRSARVARTVKYFCDVTKISEIYINDQLRRMPDLSVGDRAEIIVSRESELPLERFAVAFVYVNRDVPPAHPPTLRTSAPAASSGAPRAQHNVTGGP